jgi:hypothetical protein
MSEEEAKIGDIASEAKLLDPKAPRRRVYILHKGKWEILRMLDFMPILLKDKSARQLVDVIIEIGRKKSALISKHGGLAASGQDPPPVFGQYLAHFMILEQLYNHPPTEPFEPGSQKVGYYPMEFDEIVDKGYQRALADVAQYETAQ